MNKDVKIVVVPAKGTTDEFFSLLNKIQDTVGEHDVVYFTDGDFDENDLHRATKAGG